MKTSRSKPILWLFAPLLVACIAALVLWRGAGAASKRFVSAPLKDGTRYTFLYPARFAASVPSPPPASRQDAPLQSLNIYDEGQPSAIERARKRLGLDAANALSPRLSQIAVIVTEQYGTAKNSRVETHGAKKQTVHHTVEIHDAPSRSIVFAMHWGVDRALFDTESRTFRQSFQILPPDTPIPTP